MMKMTFKLSLYVIFTFGISWTLVIGYAIAGGSISPVSAEFFIMTLVFMFTPMISVIIIEKLFYKSWILECLPTQIQMEPLMGDSLAVASCHCTGNICIRVAYSRGKASS